ncbi:SCO family protein [Mangrovicella endophytica]|uniref:SCO family protein n=1 Tax=Mangrovicella endophytica TaxID=2066697 RepID=UPI000C9E4A55|nr:SCO family protein [Mangrovicella endophytica]
MRCRAFALLFLALLLPTVSAEGGLTRAELREAGFADRTGQMLPGDLTLTDAAGATLKLENRLGGRPALLAFVDYTCETVCGVAAEALAGAATGLTLRPGEDYRMLVAGFDPRDTTADRDAWLAVHPAVAALGRGAVLSASPAATRRLTEAAGFEAVYDAEHDQFAHPAGALLIGADGRILRALDLVSLDPDTLRLALVEASGGAAGSLLDRAILSCYGWDAATGRYTPVVSMALMGSGLFTVAAILLFLALMLTRERRSAPGPDGRRGA